MEETDSRIESHTRVQQWLRKTLHDCLKENECIALWKLPSRNEVNLIASNEVKLLKELALEEMQPGFVVAPFDTQNGKYFLPADNHFVIYSDRVERKGSEVELPDTASEKPVGKIKFHYAALPAVNPTESRTYTDLIQKSVDAIEAGEFEKVVPTRNKLVQLQHDVDPLEYFERLCKQYPNALITLLSTPQTGTWLGASPELLVKVDSNLVFHTVALAGTQRYEPGTDLRQISWTQKDIEEQALVSRYIISCFKKIRLREYEEYGPKTAQAGNLLHLKTEYRADMTATGFPTLGSIMVELLHPTSAVCGMPLDKAKQFLTKEEGYNRQLYTGYWGPVNIGQEINLFVNLRCMQLFPFQAVLYAGAGVTTDSVPQKEWEETEIKMGTLLRVMQM